nr:ribonuclease H-like domain-containing protein [Tanacetum cinerariifolium]
KTGRNLRPNGPKSMGFDMSKVECYNYHRKGHFARKCRSPKDSRRNGAAKPHRRIVLVETSTSNALVLNSDESWPPSSLYDRFQSSNRYHAVLPPYIGTFMPPKPDLVFNTAPTAVETDHPAFKVQLSLTKPEQDLSYTNRPTTPIIEDWVSDFEDESKTKAPQIVPILTFMPPKPDLVFHDAPNVNETVNTAFNVELSPTKPDTELSLRPSAPIIEDWVSDSEDDSEAELPQNAPSFVQPTEQVKTPRPFVKLVENSILAANLKTTLPKPKGHGNSRNRKACFVLLFL